MVHQWQIRPPSVQFPRFNFPAGDVGLGCGTLLNMCYDCPPTGLIHSYHRLDTLIPSSNGTEYGSQVNSCYYVTYCKKDRHGSRVEVLSGSTELENL